MVRVLELVCIELFRLDAPVSKLLFLSAGLSSVVLGDFLGSTAFGAGADAEAPPAIPRFSVSYMEREVEPGIDF